MHPGIMPGHGAPGRDRTCDHRISPRRPGGRPVPGLKWGSGRPSTSFLLDRVRSWISRAPGAAPWALPCARARELASNSSLRLLRATGLRGRDGEVGMLQETQDGDGLAVERIAA